MVSVHVPSIHLSVWNFEALSVYKSDYLFVRDSVMTMIALTIDACGANTLGAEGYHDCLPCPGGLLEPTGDTSMSMLSHVSCMNQTVYV
jgi:hypothetical protein